MIKVFISSSTAVTSVPQDIFYYGSWKYTGRHKETLANTPFFCLSNQHSTPASNDLLHLLQESMVHWIKLKLWLELGQADTNMGPKPTQGTQPNLIILDLSWEISLVSDT